MLSVIVKDGKVDSALKLLKRKIQKARVYEKARVKHHITGTQLRAMKKAEARKTIAKNIRTQGKKFEK